MYYPFAILAIKFHLLKYVNKILALEYHSITLIDATHFLRFLGGFFHLSIQSGDNLILKRMLRRHSREDVINLCYKIRKVRPEATFGADFICGFPTESVEAFENTCKLVEEAKIDKLHVFPYSERQGTPAAKMPQVDVNERRRRAKLLRNLREDNNG